MKIAFVSVSRADYGILEPLMRMFHDDVNWDMITFVTGSHLSPEFGLTIKDIKFPVTERIECLLSCDTDTAVSRAMGLALMGFASAYERHKPDMVVLLGDRFETLAAAIAAHIARIPIIHISGGEVTEGATDDAWRHSITKMASLHFPYAEEYKNRIVQLGEDPHYVHRCGCLPLDDLEKAPSKMNIVGDWLVALYRTSDIFVLYHPETLSSHVSWQDSGFDNLLLAIKDLPETVIFIKSNADAGGRTINEKIEAFLRPSRTEIQFNLDRETFLNTLKTAKVLIGNSSAGIYEAPWLGVPTINIGDRQKGRLMASSIINCEPTVDDIKRAFDKLESKEFQESLKDIKMPFYGGPVAHRIKNVIEAFKGNLRVKKKFYDLEGGKYGMLSDS